MRTKRERHGGADRSLRPCNQLRWGASVLPLRHSSCVVGVTNRKLLRSTTSLSHLCYRQTQYRAPSRVLKTKKLRKQVYDSAFLRVLAAATVTGSSLPPPRAKAMISRPTSNDF
ncbi:hypothetical protein BAUCODRAFT_304746 [Baudoinia panamericana UAMH 10762]|uniref:Uncharacterized protein n=1 Tax=Baudoinia panamericana (strain UAMH 10762) TaxID=717646 RepID=M2MYP1_BAUPA|nr:uncharacterized protein BAUCODRAFT_304746 [Baudoinia panamericana UAMH 10762]EMC91789.1 hypothetical protein BAUCODRAFT_304746 [Baudoinia panamericana UAMH 10762]